MINEKMNCAVGLALRFYREECGLKQSEIASLVGIKRPAVTLMEKGRQTLPVGLVYQWANVLGLDIRVVLKRAELVIEKWDELGLGELRSGPIINEMARRLAAYTMGRC